MSLFKKIFNKEKQPDIVLLEQDPDALVKQIHNEVDSLEQESIAAVEKMLAEIKIPTETKVVEKAKLMKSLGFSTNNEIVSQSEILVKEINEAKTLKLVNENKLGYIGKLRLAYPTDKIIPMSEFQKVLEKYNLMYAPSRSYIKDVPEKNLLEIKNSKPIKVDDTALDFKVISNIQLNGLATPALYNILTKTDLSKIIINKQLFTVKEIRIATPEEILHIKEYPSAYYYGMWVNENNRELARYYKNYVPTGEERVVEKFMFNDRDNYDVTDVAIKQLSAKLSLDESTLKHSIRSIDVKGVDRSGLFIAAPKTHFDLSNLTSYDGKEYYEKQNVKVTVVKDPIAFYILRGCEQNPNEEFVRIVSKWGTSDDQSYLDPIVQNEKLN